MKLHASMVYGVACLAWWGAGIYIYFDSKFWIACVVMLIVGVLSIVVADRIRADP